MSRIRLLARNLVANQVGYLANVVIMFFLTPYVVDTLGPAVYGIWSLLVAVTFYMGLVELGTRAGLGRHVMYYVGRDDATGVNAMVSTGLAAFTVISLIVLLAAGGIGALFNVIFPKTPVEMLDATRLALLLVALNLCLSLYTSVFRQIVVARERFDVTCVLGLVSLVVRSGLIVFVLQRGGGIVALAASQLAAAALELVLTVLAAHRQYPALRPAMSLITRARWKELLGFSLWAFVTNASMHILYFADQIIIGSYFGPEAVTYYSLGGTLLMYARDAINQVAGTFTPELIRHCAKGDLPAARYMFLRSSKLVMIAAVLVLVGLVTFGRQFYVLWMGDQFDVSYQVAAILSCATLPAMTMMTAAAVFLGLGKVGVPALATAAQALTSLTLVFIFILGLDMGLLGVAWGTFYARTAFVLVSAVMVVHWIKVRPWLLVRELGLRPALLAGLFGLLCWQGATLIEGRGWPEFFAAIVAATVVYLPLAWFLMLSRADRVTWSESIAKLLGRPPRQAVGGGDG
jgi:O-antigen/teichoic acid export membrane protein